MIGWLAGKILEKHSPGKFVLNVQGVGYEVETSLSTFFLLENLESIELYIHTIVREDAMLLYGFHNKQEQELFRLLIRVNGIGPKLAIGILSAINPDEFIVYISQQNTTALTRLPGIGKKTAERLVIEMKDKILSLETSGISVTENKLYNEHSQAISALEALGYRTTDAAKAVKELDDGQKSCELLIRQALQILSARA